MSQHRITLRSTAVRLAAVAVLAGASTGFAASSAPADEPGTTPDVRAKTMAAELTPEQADELRTQWATGRKLSPQQALKAAGLSRSELVSAPARRTVGVIPDEGQATSKLNCSEMTLWGDSDGHWAWDNHFWPRKVGPATYGVARVTTDGLASTTDTFDYSGTDQMEVGHLFSAGAWPDATEINTWSVNSNPAGKTTLCLGILRAPYE